MLNIIFLGGIQTNALADYIRENSIGPMQNAADVLQKNYIFGLSKIASINRLDVVNLPFVGSYPQYFRNKKFRAQIKREKIYNICDVYNYSFNNVKGLKNLARFFISLRAIQKIKKEKNECRVVCYSMHLPFLLSCFVNRFFNKSNKYYVIIPDLPEYMSARGGVSKVFHSFISKISYHIVNRSNGVVFITSQMAERFSPGLEHVVIEGILPHTSHPIGCQNDWWPEYLIKKRYFLYTGTLDKRYGIRDLIDSYISSNVKDIMLVIAGDGDDRKYVENMSLHYANIKYMGQLEHHKAKVLQTNAALLINPRSNEEEYTKYSFPSKIIEYMNSGVPILMYKLDGIPKSYNEFFFHIVSKNQLSNKLNEISEMSNAELDMMGEKAKIFITEQGDPVKQVSKLVSLFSDEK
ncbi:glycosyltransferase [Citrobacter freundii]|uniref:glycosyltransferase n=1 Tax=Citrobacter freundii TaxID=546 RepID=UPI0015E507D5|nr:glycosyltransferase [Citrobacter freundii]QLO42237.1 glycosyltransferase [Citrobacter freundii]QLV40401.1 glycosyltransferase [Citrobacter freundii]